MCRGVVVFLSCPCYPLGLTTALFEGPETYFTSKPLRTGHDDLTSFLEHLGLCSPYVGLGRVIAHEFITLGF